MAVSNPLAKLEQRKLLAEQEILTLAEGADYLRISERKCWELCDRNEVPHFRVGNGIRLRLSELREWQGTSGDGRRDS